MEMVHLAVRAVEAQQNIDVVLVLLEYPGKETLAQMEVLMPVLVVVVVVQVLTVQ
jgi:hypothetical protein